MLLLVFFFFKQKTAYEMRISDWSSDVCSSDLGGRVQGPGPAAGGRLRRAPGGGAQGLAAAPRRPRRPRLLILPSGRCASVPGVSAAFIAHWLRRRMVAPWPSASTCRRPPGGSDRKSVG